MHFPSIDPVVCDFGIIKIHWYGVAYVVGIILSYRWLLRQFHQLSPNYQAADKNAQNSLTTVHLDNFMSWLILAILMGGRLGHVLFYDLNYYYHHPIEIFQVWRGGMAFHGGLCGVAVAVIAYCRHYRLPLWQLADLLAMSTPIALGLGRISNFINAELYGMPTTMPWGVIFPNGGNLPRHPTQIYEAILEGPVLWWLINYGSKKLIPACWQNSAYFATALFFFGYGMFRIIVEQFKDPEYLLPIGNFSIPYGTLLSLPMLFCGVWCLYKTSLLNKLKNVKL